MQFTSPARVGRGYAIRTASLAVAALFFAAQLSVPLSAQIPIGPYAPHWADAEPLNLIPFDYDPVLDSRENGTRVMEAILALQPGDELQIGGGVYNINHLFDINLQGTAQHPIWITARAGAQVVFTRPDEGQNVINFGQNHGVPRFLALQGIEVRGGSIGLRIYDASDLWLDRLHVHHTGDAAISANREDTEFLYITRNHIHHTSGYGEGMYLGANNGEAVMSHSVIALNYVHHTDGGWQGDGIEIKQGSYDNWVAQNVIHDTNYPCLLVYGTDGEAPNRIERNILYRSNDNVLQVQGEAIVTNNLIMDGAIGFNSHDHQGQTRDLVFAHNTIINRGLAADLHSWSGRPGMVFANNAVYSRDSQAIRLPGGPGGVTIEGNVVFGELNNVPSGYSEGNGLQDFEDVSWDASERVAVPTTGGPLVRTITNAFRHTYDLNGMPRDYAPAEAVGAFALGSYGTYYGRGVPNHSLERPVPIASRYPRMGDQGFSVRVVNARPRAIARLLFNFESAEVDRYYGGTMLVGQGRILHTVTDDNGRAQINIPLIDDLVQPGTQMYFQWVVYDPQTVWGATLSEGFEVVVR